MDRSFASFNVYAVPDLAAAEAVRAILLEENFEAVAWSGLALDGEGLRLGLTYEHSGMVAGSIGEVARRVAKLGVSFEAAQDGIDAAGLVFRHTPALGLFHSADIDGEVAVSSDALLDALDTLTDPDAIRRQVLVLTGRPWQQALTAADQMIDADPEFPGLSISRPLT